MKLFRLLLSSLLLTMMLPGHSLAQQYIDDSDLYAMNGTKYQGKKYLYYNLLTYDGTQVIPPMPFQSDRIRDGKYKASTTAMNNYIEEFKKNDGKTFTFVKFAPNPQMANLAGAVFASETSDTVFVSASGVKEFFSVEYLEKEKKNIGKKLYEIDFTSVLSSIKDTPTAIPAFFTYSDAKTKELKPSFLPFMSEWTIKDVNYDTTYYGEHSAMNDVMNGIQNRLYYVIENEKYGSLICFFNESKHTFSKDKAYQKIVNLHFRYSDYKYEGEDLQLLGKWAKDGTADMKYFYYAVAEEKGKSKEEIREEIVKLAEQGSVVAAYKLVCLPLYNSSIPYDKLSEIVKKVCHSKEKLSTYSDMCMKMGNLVSIYGVTTLCESKKDLDKALTIGKEMFKLAEDCGADAQKVSEAIAKLEEKYNDLCKEAHFSSND